MNIAFGIDVRAVEILKFSPESYLSSEPWDFCVTDDNRFLIPDPKDGNIKLYKRDKASLDFVDIIGEKGLGQHQLAKPTYCFFNKVENKFGVLDFDNKKIVVYNNIQEPGMPRPDKVVSCLTLGYDIHLSGDKLLISGYRPAPDGNPYDLYYINLEDNNDQINFILPSHFKYGLKDFFEYDTKYRAVLDLKAIGIFGWFDIQGNDIYFVWEGDIRIIKWNIESGKRKFFGKKTSHYKRPVSTPQLLKEYSAKGNIRNEKAKMSYVRNIFTNSYFVLVIYEGPISKSNDSNFRLQSYTLDGEFLGDVPIPGKPDRRMWFDKDKSILYSLSKSDKNYFITEYFIE